MSRPERNVSLYGTAEPPQALRSVKVGPLSFLYSRGSLRRLSWHGTELVRGLAWPIRDENWGTYPPDIHDEQLEDDGETFTANLQFSVADGRLDCRLRITATAEGEVQADLTMTPLGGPFATNRAGFTVLHPLTGTVGRPLSVTHSDGTLEQTLFPQLIQPSQPVMDIQGLSYSVGAARVDLTFDGDVFEMEDQRNWSDASFKTYCVPLVHPFTYPITALTTQSISLTCAGEMAADNRSARRNLAARPTETLAPKIGLALQPGWTGDAEAQKLVAKTGASHVLMRYGPTADPAFLADCSGLSDEMGATLDAEIVLEDTRSVAEALQSAADDLANHGLEPKRVLALREAYLGSHQPSGPWPDGPTPTDVCKAVRTVFSSAQVGGGMLTNFTEMNRCPPDPAHCDFVSHASSAIVHAGDDLSVLETLETLPQIFESAAAMAGEKPYRLGLVSIGMRTNPYGADVAENPTQIRRTMARADPRQRGLFGAAWAVGVLAATRGSAVEALCLAAPTGPLGIVHAPQSYPQVGYDGAGSRVYPLFHIVCAASGMAGANRLDFADLPDGVAAFGVHRDGTNHAMLANITDQPVTVPLAQTAAVAVMDAESFDAAISDADWLENTERQSVTQLDLGPFAIAFARWGD